MLDKALDLLGTIVGNALGVVLVYLLDKRAGERSGQAEAMHGGRHFRRPGK